MATLNFPIGTGGKPGDRDTSASRTPRPSPIPTVAAEPQARASKVGDVV